MTTPDLPVELWLEILAYLPRSAVHKTLGINRVLFELALNDIYEEIRLVNDDAEMVKVLKQLRHPNIADRVQRLYIRPAFLPGMDEQGEGTGETSSLSKLGAGIDILKNTLRVLKLGLPSSEPSPSGADTAGRIFALASKAIKQCVNLRRLTIVVYDHALTPPFMEFLDSLYRSNSLGPNLIHLAIDTTAAKLPFLAGPLIKRASSLTNLNNFDFTLSDSRFSQTEVEYNSACRALKSLFETFSKSLATVAISTSIALGLKTFFNSIPPEVPIKNLQIFAVFNMKALPDFGEFLSQRAKTLESLLLSAHPRQTSFHATHQQYLQWMGHSETQVPFGFSRLRFPKLHSLEIELLEPISYSGVSTSTIPLPPLDNVSPHITRLVLTHRTITFKHLAVIADGLPTFESQKTQLEQFEFCISLLCPQVFDLLSIKAPRLRSLTINYNASSSTSEKPSTREAGKKGVAFLNVILARRYPSWKLSKIRLAELQSSNHSHPNTLFTQAVASTLSNDVVMDLGYSCECAAYPYGRA